MLRADLKGGCGREGRMVGGVTTASLVAAANRKLSVAAGNKQLNACAGAPAAVCMGSLLFWDDTQR